MVRRWQAWMVAREGVEHQEWHSKYERCVGTSVVRMGRDRSAQGRGCIP